MLNEIECDSSNRKGKIPFYFHFNERPSQHTSEVKKKSLNIDLNEKTCSFRT